MNVRSIKVKVEDVVVRRLEAGAVEDERISMLFFASHVLDLSKPLFCFNTAIYHLQLQS